ncbi:RNA exonuclease ngl2 [Balamuthia mandrillaris]
MQRGGRRRQVDLAVAEEEEEGSQQQQHQGHANGEEKKGRRIKVVQYNVLAEELASEGTRWRARPTRLQELLAEVVSHQADVLCLQELDRYYDFWKDALRSHGYEEAKYRFFSLSFSRFRSSCFACTHSLCAVLYNMYPPNDRYEMRATDQISTHSHLLRHDGAGIFYNVKELRLLSAMSIRFADGKDRLMVMAGFQTLPSSATDDKKEEEDKPEETNVFMVVTTHLYYKTEAKRLQEIKEAAHHVRNFRDLLWEYAVQLKYGRKPHAYRIYPASASPSSANAREESWTTEMQIDVSRQVPVLVCGDFNSEPWTEAPPSKQRDREGDDEEEQPEKRVNVFQYMKTDFLRVGGFERRGNMDPRFHDVEDREEEEQKKRGTIPEMESAYHYKREPRLGDACTSVNVRRKQVLDYIWYSKLTLRPTSLLELPTIEELLAENKEWSMEDEPSDHFPLVAEFQFLSSSHFDNALQKELSL